MTLLAFGINHKTAPVSLRERVAFTPDSLVCALDELNQLPGVTESVIVSTCNRTELYVHTKEQYIESVANWLAQFHAIDTTQVSSNSYSYVQEEAVRHIMRVASGLDSLVLGEPQILGQIKQAYNDARHSGAINSTFEKLFQSTFSVAKRVRSETEIGANAVSVAYASVQLAKHIFSALPTRKVLLVGAGETIELVAQHLKEQGVTQLSVANRTISRGQLLADKLGATVLTLAQLPEHLHHYDIVISSTASQLPLIGKGMVEDALRKRKNQPMFLVDLAVPRDIEEQVNELGDAYLYSVDDLQHIVEQNLASREVAAQEAEKIIEEQVQVFMAWQHAQKSIDLVRQYRQRTKQQSDALLQRAQKQLADGQDAQSVLNEFAHKLSNALMHEPTKLLRDAASDRNEEYKQRIAKAFDLDLSANDNNKG